MGGASLWPSQASPFRSPPYLARGSLSAAHPLLAAVAMGSPPRTLFASVAGLLLRSSVLPRAGELSRPDRVIGGEGAERPSTGLRLRYDDPSDKCYYHYVNIDTHKHCSQASSIPFGCSASPPVRCGGWSSSLRLSWGWSCGSLHCPEWGSAPASRGRRGAPSAAPRTASCGGALLRLVTSRAAP